VPPELVAQSLGEWFRAWLTRIRSGDSGVLPVLLALLIITIVFEAISPNNVFLSAGNIVNLFQQSAVFMVLAMGELFVILLGEIDLSIGYAGGVGAAITVQLVQPSTAKWPWWGAVLAGLLVCVVIGIAALLWFGDSRRRRSGLVAPPVSLTLIKIVLIAIVGISVVAICNINRAANGTLAGVPWVIPIVLAVFGAWMVLLQRTKFGRYVYAIGGNPEAARRAGINLAAVRTLCFIICSFT